MRLKYFFLMLSDLDLIFESVSTSRLMNKFLYLGVYKLKGAMKTSKRFFCLLSYNSDQTKEKIIAFMFCI